MMNHLKFLAAAFILLVLAGSASAWGNKTYMYACDEAVKYVWGSEVLQKCVYDQNLEFQKSFCNVVKTYVGDEAYKTCLEEKEVIHPALLPEIVFNDQEKHRDYSSCPINNPMDSKFLCSDIRANPALDNAQTWFAIASDPNELCTRIYEFCIGSNYMADSFNPLNHVLYGVDEGECQQTMEQKVEDKILENSPAGWGVNQVCVFKYTRSMSGQGVGSRYSQQFSISNKTFLMLLQNLTVYAGEMQNKTFMTTTTTTTEPTTTTEETIPTTIATTIPTTTLPAVTSTTMPESKEGGISLLQVLIGVLVLVAIAYFALQKKPGEAGKSSTLGGGGARADRILNRPTLRSLQSESGVVEGIIPEDKTMSALGSIRTGKEPKE